MRKFYISKSDLNHLKQLAGQTAIYGLGTIVPRLFNFLLMTPFYTRIFQKGEYGVVTELYAYTALLIVLLTYGMETTFFRFSEKENKENVLSTSFISLLFTSIPFMILVMVFATPIANMIEHSANVEYVIYFGIIIGLDALTAIPFARLRQQNKAFRFAIIKIINVSIQVGLNLFFLWLCPVLIKQNPDSVLTLVYSPDVGVGYAFISNLVASIVTLLLLIPDILNIRFKFDKALFKQMLNYTFPILIVGLLGMFNEVSDKIFLKYLWPEKSKAMEIVGIYGANFKLAVLLTIFTQMFRYAAEPFFFAKEKEKNSGEMYADVMKFFIIFGLLIFLGVTLYIDFAKYFIDEPYWEGLHIVPIVLMAKLFFGITINLSIWYKLTDMTRFGAYMNLIGTAIIIVVNVLFISVIGYLASAWAQFICYAVIMIISYFLGQKYYKIKYDLISILGYFILAVAIYIVSRYIKIDDLPLKTGINTMLILLFVIIVFLKEKLAFRKIAKP